MSRARLTDLLNTATPGPWYVSDDPPAQFKRVSNYRNNDSRRSIMSVPTKCAVPVRTRRDDAALICFLRNRADGLAALWDAAQAFADYAEQYPEDTSGPLAHDFLPLLNRRLAALVLLDADGKDTP